MSVWLAIILGIVQGLTEFFPVSSSGHLALAGVMGGLHEADLVFDILLHLATLAAILVYFRHDWLQLFRLVFKNEPGDLPRWIPGYLVLATLPAVVVGFSMQDIIASLHNNVAVVGAMLIITGVVLLAGLLIRKQGVAYAEMTWLMAIAMGVAQAFAILPGISRSGSTIMLGVFLGLSRQASARFSFLMAVPVIAGAGVLAVKDLMEVPLADSVNLVVPYSAGCVAAFLSGFLALKFLMRLLNGSRFFYFGFYCLAVGVSAFVWGLLRS